jgi:hypothetical protein
MKSGGIFEKQNQGNEGVTTPLLLVVFASLIAGLVIPTPTLGGMDKTVSEVCAKSVDAATRAKYCSAAKDLKSGYNANIATSAVWTGVSVACGAACGKQMDGIACKIASTGGSAGEGLITKKFADSIMSEGTKWGGDAVASAATGTATGGADASASTSTSKLNADACTTAGQSALKATGKYLDSKTTSKSLADIKDQTKGMNTTANEGQTYVAVDSSAATTSAATANTSGICGDSSITTALGAIKCAVTKDPSLPPYVQSQEFLQDLQKATGKSPDAFFSNFESPAKSIFDSPLAAGLSDGQQKGLADSLSAMEGYSESHASKVASNSPTEAYSGAGASRAADAADTGFDMNGMIAGVLGQMNGAADGANSAGTPVAIGTLAANRKPAGNPNAAEDRKMSIFDRVQGRYGAISARDRLGGL